MISSCHGATEEWTGRMNRYDGTATYKPSCILEYMKNMDGIDLSD